MPQPLKKVLIVCYYWPPSGGSGVQRWLKFVKYLRQFGWEPIVYTPENPDFNLQDESLLKEVPPGITVIKQPIWEPFKAYKLFTGKDAATEVNPVMQSAGKKPSFKSRLAVWIRANLFIPDARRFWIAPSVKFLTRYLQDNPVDAVVTTGPPHSMLLIGLGIKEKLNLPWLADFRDPWTMIDFYSELPLTKWGNALHHKLEARVLQKADAVTVVGNTMKQEFAAMGRTDVEVVTNGYDEGDFENLAPVTLDNRFSIIHVGMLGKARNHPVFWQAIQELVTENPALAASLTIDFYGKADPVVSHSVNEYGVQAYVRFLPYKPHKEIIEVQRKAQVLLLSVNNSINARGILTGKMFEYLAIQRPVLCIGPHDGDAAIIINSTGAGLVAGFEEKDVLKQHLLTLYERYKTGSNVISSNGYARFSRRALTESMAAVLNSIVKK